jgi:hypothetical protein
VTLRKGETNVVTLTRAQALVLFEWLSINEADFASGTSEAERLVLVAVLCQLEEQLAEPFLQNYQEILDEARTAVRDEEYGSE